MNRNTDDRNTDDPDVDDQDVEMSCAWDSPKGKLRITRFRSEGAIRRMIILEFRATGASQAEHLIIPKWVMDALSVSESMDSETEQEIAD